MPACSHSPLRTVARHQVRTRTRTGAVKLAFPEPLRSLSVRYDGISEREVPPPVG